MKATFKATSAHMTAWKPKNAYYACILRLSSTDRQRQKQKQGTVHKMETYTIEVQDDIQGPWRDWFANGRPESAYGDGRGGVTIGPLSAPPVITSRYRAELILAFVGKHFRVHALKITTKTRTVAA
jgi:hypothetical protein